MNLLFLRFGDTDTFLYSEEPRTADVAEPHPPEDEPWRTRLRKKVRNSYDVIKQRFDYEENLCAALRHANYVHLIHSDRVEESHVQARLIEFLSARQKKHTRWMWMDAGLALMGSLMTPIPGPNIFFMYPAVRAMSHYFARKGVDKANSLSSFSFSTDPLVTIVEDNRMKLDEVCAQVEELEHRYGFSNIKVRLERL